LGLEEVWFAAAAANATPTRIMISVSRPCNYA